MHSVFLTVENMSKSYGKFLALDNFSCEIPQGVTGLLGPNGAGKTTFIRSLLGIHSFTAGRIQFLEYELPKDLLIVKDMIGYQPEVDTQLKKTSASQYVTHMARLAGLPHESAKQRSFDTLHYVGLEEARYREMETFSQGMLQKVKLATALVHDPLLLLLDEPTAGCDPSSREQILTLIHDLGNNYGKNIIISTHLLPDIERTADYVVVMSKGKTVMQGDLSQVLNAKQSGGQIIVRVSGNQKEFANILEKNDVQVIEVNTEIICLVKPDRFPNNDYSELFQLASSANMNIRKISPFRIGLEDVFLDAVEGTMEVGS